MEARAVLGFACAATLWAGTAIATPTPQQACDYARITAWKAYTSCIEAVVAKDAKGLIFDEDAAFARCRHTYFKKWTAFQPKASLAGSTCIGARYTDNGDQTVTDNLSGLTWEKKDNAGGVHDRDNTYTWSPGSPYKENGTAFTTFLSTVNSAGGFGGANGWRLPTVAELQTIVLDFACTGGFLSSKCTCASSPCVDPMLDPANTQPWIYWCATSYVPELAGAWLVNFDLGFARPFNKADGGGYARAVRGGL